MTQWIPCQLSFIEKLWWRFMPGVVINVRWPRGWVVLDDDGQGGQTAIESTDPNDHYRPELTKLVGRQGWDWQWGMGGHDATEDRLTIKIRRRHAQWASYFALKWGS